MKHRKSRLELQKNMELILKRMRANYFGLKFWQNYLLAFSAAILLTVLFSFQAAAQPGDCRDMNWKPEVCRREREVLLQKIAAEIKALDEKILRQPNNAELYYRRGKIYSAMMFEQRLGFNTVEFDGRVYFSEIDAKAIADYTQAISLAPQPAYLEARGDIYRAYWEKEIPSLGIGENKPKEETLKLVERLFLNNENFKAAARNFRQAVELGADREMSKKPEQKLTQLYQLRASSLGNYEDIAAAVSTEKAGDIALADQAYVIEYYRNLYARSQSRLEKGNLQIKWDREYVYDALINKGKMARNFGRDDLALKVFNEAEKYWDKAEGRCFVFTYRASIFLKRDEIDLALRELTTAIDSKNPNCRETTHFRGDVYFRKGEWRAAIEDYTAYLNAGYGEFSELYLKRGTAYLKLGDAEKALADFDYLIEKLFHKSCPQFYLLRAEGYKLTGKLELAEADEKAASELPKNRKDSWCQINLLN